MRSAIETGTKKYLSLYARDCGDGVLRLGNVVPDFSCDTTHGHWKSFHAWKKEKWAVLFSHPADFTPVCTTELIGLAEKYHHLCELDCLVATLSVDPVKTHRHWLDDVEHLGGEGCSIDFPIIADADREIAMAYGMLDPYSLDNQKLPFTVRSVFFINPENKLMLELTYPVCVGRNMSEIVRCVEALQLSYKRSVATPCNWPKNHATVRMPDGSKTKEFKGGVIVMPTVSKQDAARHYPGHYTQQLPSGKTYMRLVRPQEVGYFPKSKPKKLKEKNHSSSSSKSSKTKKKIASAGPSMIDEQAATNSTSSSTNSQLGDCKHEKETTLRGWFRRNSSSYHGGSSMTEDESEERSEEKPKEETPIIWV